MIKRIERKKIENIFKLRSNGRRCQTRPSKCCHRPSPPFYRLICRSAVFYPPTVMDDESADILGQQTKIAFRSGKGSDNDAWLGTSLIVKLVLGFVIILFLYVVSMQIWFRILVWRERSYKLCVYLSTKGGFRS